MKKTFIKINRNEWAEAGINRGYIVANEKGELELRKEAIAVLAPLAIGAGAYLAELAVGGIWNASTGNASFSEVWNNFEGATTDSVAQYERGLITLQKEVQPKLQGASIKVKEAVDEAIKQGYTTLEQLNSALISRGMAPPRVAQKEAEEARKRKALEEKNFITLYNAAQKPVGGQRPGSPQTMKADTSPADAAKSTIDNSKQASESSIEVARSQGIPIPQTATPGKAASPSGGRRLNPRIFGGV